MEIVLRYQTKEISDEQAATVASTLDKALSSILKSPEDPFRSLDLFSDHDKDILSRWNATPPPTIDTPVTEIFKLLTTMQPGAEAIDGWDDKFTYFELDRLTDKLAIHLASLGVGLASKVPICFGKSSWTIVAMLAILKAGATFVPLDPNAPVERLRGLIEDTNSVFALTSAAMHAKIQDLVGIVMVISPSTCEDLPEIGSSQLPTVTSDSEAYILFTSGSTGKPKGVVISHRALTSSGAEQARVLYMDSKTRFFQFSAYTFDGCIMEILTCLMHGGCVCIPTDEDRRSNIEGSLTALRATHAFFTPSILHTMNIKRISSLKVLILGGEAVSQDIADSLNPDTKNIIIYGPTETTVFATNALITPDVPAANQIGLGMSSLTWVVDPEDHNILMPLGAIGELVLSGPALAERYLNEPVKTEKAFMKSPTWPIAKPAERIYKTGDLVYYLPDGTLYYVGRKDSQVKLHGQRLELGEVEYQIMRCLPAGSEVVVTIVQTAGGSQLLAAFVRLVIFPTGTQVAVTQMTPMLHGYLSGLQVSLTESLPAYMVPSLFVHMDVMPKSSAGKVDRNSVKALAASFTHEQIRLFSLSQAEGKRRVETEMEKVIQSIWSKALDTSADNFGSEDNFFQVGGDSLSAMRAVSVAQDMGIHLTVADIFNNPKMSDLAVVARKVPSGRVEPKPQPVIQWEPQVQPVRPFELLPTNSARRAILHEIQALGKHPIDSVEDIYPCTPMQEGLFALTQLDSSAYLLQQAYRLPESINIQRFRAAWEKLFSDSPILRTALVSTKTLSTYQVVHKLPLPWNHANSLQEYLEADKKISTSNGQLLSRFAIIEEEHDRYFVWTAHHAGYDGYAMGMILDKLYRLYERLPAATMNPYSEFVRYLNSNSKDDSDSYWRGQLSGFTRKDFPRVPSANYQIRADKTARDVIHVSHNSSSGITLGVMLQAAWALVVSRKSESKDIAYGSTMSGRNTPLADIDKILGPTVTTVPLRFTIDGSQLAKDFMTETQKHIANMAPFQHFGLQQIQSLDTSARDACNFQNLFAIQNGGEATGRNWKLDPLPGSVDRFFSYPLAVECALGEQSIELVMHYDPRVISSMEINRTMRLFEHIAQQLAQSSPTTKLSDIDFLTPEDRSQIFQWNKDYPEASTLCLHELIELGASQFPDRPAIFSSDREITYRELDNLSNRLAAKLAEAGVGKNDHIPVCMEKSAWALIAMIAVNKAGAAFVPMDPSHPKSRLEDIASQVQAKLVITLPSSPSLSVASFEVSPASLRGVQSTRESSALNIYNPSAVAYILFTSGSTGKPKGVLVSHRSICTSLTHCMPQLGLTQKSRTLQFASYSFDAFISETFSAFVVGGCVCVPSESQRLGGDLAETINSLKVNWLCLTPSVLRLLAPENVPSVETVIIVGEPYGQDLLDSWAEKTRLINGYGPTECSVGMAYKPLTKTSLSGELGFAVGARAWIVEPEDHNKLPPIGAVGELIVQGPTVTSGYIGDTAQTAKAFIQAPSWCRDNNIDQHRFYKTGDLVSYADNGMLVYIGRKDAQIKINGQRVELGEIENTLRTICPGKDLAVLFPKSGPHANRIVTVLAALDQGAGTELCFAAGEDKESVESLLPTIMDEASNLLPLHMIPSTWLAVGGLPQSTSGKTDRKKIMSWLQHMDVAVSDSEMLRVKLDESSTSSKSHAEKCLQANISEILNIPLKRVALNRSFTNIGGDSITAMQLVSRSRSQGLETSVSSILRSRSISEIATLAEQSPAPVHSVEETFDTPFSLSPIQQMFIDKIAPTPKDQKRFNQSFFLKLTRQVDFSTLSRALKVLVTRHSMLRARFSKGRDGKWTQTVPSKIAGSYRFSAHELDSQDEAADITSTTQDSLNILRGPVFAADFCNISGGGQLLFLVAHHLVIDLVSWRAVIQDLEEFINTGSMTENPVLPFQNWLELQEEHAKTLSLDEVVPFQMQSADTSYWQMGTDPNVFGSTSDLTFSLNSDHTSALLGDCNIPLHTKPLDIFLGAALYSFGKTFTDRTLPTIFTESHGREPWDSTIDLNSTLGWFTTLCPVQISTNSDDGIFSTVRRVKDCRRAILDNGRPYFASRFLNEEGKSRFGNQGATEIVFNYAGQYQQLERPDALFRLEPREGDQYLSDVDDDLERMAVFDMGATVTNGELTFTITYPNATPRKQQIMDWWQSYREVLVEAAMTMASMDSEATLSDYPLMTLTEEQLHKLTNKLRSETRITGVRDIEDIYPVTDMQQALLLGQSKSPELYMTEAVFKVSSEQNQGMVDIDCLENAWRSVVARHASLRTIFTSGVSEQSLLLQIVLKNFTAPVVRHSTIDCDEIDIALQETLDEDYSQRPQHRLTIYPTDAGYAYIKLEITHAVIDGSSLDVLFRDLTQAYHGQLPAGRGPLFSDYMSYLQQANIQQSFEHWEDHLSGIEPCLMPLLSEGCGVERQLQVISTALPNVAELYAFCKTHDFTLSNVIQAAWGIALRSFTNSDSVCFGYAVAGRDAPVEGIRDAVGLFMNTLVCRVDINDHITSVELTQKVKSDHINNLPHSHCPLGQVQHRLNLGGMQLFNTAMTFLSVQDGDKPANGSLEFECIKAHDPTEVSETRFN
jgi:amino acid adenylation domain-containing protein/non-ribosomal peptide synthase protein (TIGR01720 family)